MAAGVRGMVRGSGYTMKGCGSWTLHSRYAQWTLHSRYAQQVCTVYTRLRVLMVRMCDSCDDGVGQHAEI
jgi:hypothetical protein